LIAAIHREITEENWRESHIWLTKHKESQNQTTGELIGRWLPHLVKCLIWRFKRKLKQWIR
jgi:hypothetical protein